MSDTPPATQWLEDYDPATDESPELPGGGGFAEDRRALEDERQAGD